MEVSPTGHVLTDSRLSTLDTLNNNGHNVARDTDVSSGLPFRHITVLQSDGGTIGHSPRMIAHLGR